MDLGDFDQTDRQRVGIGLESDLRESNQQKEGKIDERKEPNGCTILMSRHVLGNRNANSVA